jgi:hypothetical protein
MQRATHPKDGRSDLLPQIGESQECCQGYEDPDQSILHHVHGPLIRKQFPKNQANLFHFILPIII